MLLPEALEINNTPKKFNERKRNTCPLGVLGGSNPPQKFMNFWGGLLPKALESSNTPKKFMNSWGCCS